MIYSCPLTLELTSGFSTTNARSLALAAQWAYQLTPTIEGTLTDTQCIFIDAGAAYVLAFRGTADIRDWLTDCKFLLRSWLYGGSVHDGFRDGILDVINDVSTAIQNAPNINGSKPLFITGHSLGGALAILAAHILSVRNVFIQGVYTYGQPRVGDRAFAANYNSRLGPRTFRLVYENDLVPHVPLPGLLFRYLQNATEVFLREHYAGIPHLEFNRPIGQKLVSDGLMLFHAWRLILACKTNPILGGEQLIEAVKQNHAIENYILHLNSIT